MPSHLSCGACSYNLVDIAGHVILINSLTCLADSSRSRLIAAGGEKGKVYIWDIRSGKLYKTLEGHKAAVSCVVFNSADTHVISGSFGGEIIVHNLTSMRASPPLRASEKVGGLACFCLILAVYNF